MVVRSKETVIYTAITGNYDNLITPAFVSEDFDYVCFTDNPKLKSDVWKIIHIKNPELDTIRQARHVKILPHLYLSNYQYSIWMDANITIVRDIGKFLIAKLQKSSIALYRHSDGRNCIYKEGYACIKLKKDDPQIIQTQMEKYQKLNYPKHNGLVSSGIIFRRHHDPQIIKLMEDWWYEVFNHSVRDQLSFNYVAYKNNIPFTVIHDYIRNNRYFKWRKHPKHPKKQ